MSDEEKVAVPEEAGTPVEANEPSMADIMHDPNAPIITVRKLLEAGVQFGHQTRRWNPKMSKYIYGDRNGIYIIDLNKTVERTNASYKALKAIVEGGGKVLFVGIKPQARQIVAEEAVRSGSFYITNRWLGGTLTNFRTILGRVKKLRDLEAKADDGTFDRIPKKEAAILKKELAKLKKNLEGIKEMRRLPQAVVVTDPALEHNAVSEAKKLNIPVFGLCDTSDDPDLLDFPVPTNNDAQSALKLLVGVLADAVVEAKGGVTEIAYTKDEGKEATMKDAIIAADIANEQRKAAIRAQRKEREERYAKMQAERMARYAARNAERAKAEKPEEKPAEEAKPEVKPEGETK